MILSNFCLKFHQMCILLMAVVGIGLSICVGAGLLYMYMYMYMYVHACVFHSLNERYMKPISVTFLFVIIIFHHLSLSQFTRFLSFCLSVYAFLLLLLQLFPSGSVRCRASENSVIPVSRASSTFTGSARTVVSAYVPPATTSPATRRMVRAVTVLDLYNIRLEV